VPGRWFARVALTSRARPPARDVQVEDLSRGRGHWGAALDAEQLGISPRETHDRLCARTPTDCREEPRRDPAFRGPDAPAGGAAVARPRLLLDELVIRGASAETCWQHFLEHPDDVGVEEGHATCSEFLEAPNHVQMGGPAQVLKRTSAARERSSGTERATPANQGRVVKTSG